MDFSDPTTQSLLSVLSIFLSAYVAYKYWLKQRRKELADELFKEFHSVEMLRVRRMVNKNLIRRYLNYIGPDNKISVSRASGLCVPGTEHREAFENFADACSPDGDLYITDQAIELSHLFHFFERIVILESIGDLDRTHVRLLFGEYFGWWTKNLFDKLDLSQTSVGNYRHVLVASKIRYLV